jgi:hypothetical protein
MVHGHILTQRMDVAGLHAITHNGMVQAWVAQKLVKRDILRVFTMSLFCSGTPIPQEPRQFRSRLL